MRGPYVDPKVGPFFPYFVLFGPFGWPHGSFGVLMTNLDQIVITNLLTPVYVRGPVKKQDRIENRAGPRQNIPPAAPGPPHADRTGTAGTRPAPAHEGAFRGDCIGHGAGNPARPKRRLQDVMAALRPAIYEGRTETRMGSYSPSPPCSDTWDSMVYTPGSGVCTCIMVVVSFQFRTG